MGGCGRVQTAGACTGRCSDTGLSRASIAASTDFQGALQRSKSIAPGTDWASARTGRFHRMPSSQPAPKPSPTFPLGTRARAVESRGQAAAALAPGTRVRTGLRSGMTPVGDDERPCFLQVSPQVGTVTRKGAWTCVRAMGGAAGPGPHTWECSASPTRECTRTRVTCGPAVLSRRRAHVARGTRCTLPTGRPW